MKQQFRIAGMSCAACSARIERVIGKLSGVTAVSVNLLGNSMVVEYDGDKLNSAALITAVQKIGYDAVLLEENYPKERTKEQQAAEKGLKKRLVFSVLLLIPLFYLGMYHMLPHPHAMAVFFETKPLAYALSQLILVIPICILNRKFFIVGFRSLFQRAPNMDSLIAIGASAALVYGFFAIGAIIYGLLTDDILLAEHYGKSLYFESAGMILALVTVGKFLEEKSKGRTGSAIEKLLSLAPQSVFVEKDGEIAELDIAQLQVGDIIIVKQGSRIPADGVIIEGSSEIDESALTGESMSVERGVDDRIFCATTNQSGLLKMRVEQMGKDTVLAQIIRLVEEAAASKAPIAQFADRISAWFVPSVMAISAFTLIAWLLFGYGFEFAFSCAIAVLVISCPCALGLATPVAITVGTGKGAEYGVLIKSGEALQRAQELDTIIFDKTGTLTGGQPVLTEIVPMAGLNEKRLLLLAASAEQGSEHVLAKAVLQKAKQEHLKLLPQSDFQAVFGKGVHCLLEGQRYYAGNKSLMSENGIMLSETAELSMQLLAEQGQTPLLFADSEQLLGVLAVEDSLRPEAYAVVRRLQQDGLNVMMLTGDNKRTAEAIRDKLGLQEAIAEVLPADKESKIAFLRAQGKNVAMVGDGINDAPALKRATIGIAIGSGTDIAIEAADIVLMRNELSGVVFAIELAHKTIKNIRENLFWAFFYNILGIPIAAGLLYPAFHILLNPMLAAAAMSLSSLFVVTNALRLKFFRFKM